MMGFGGIVGEEEVRVVGMADVTAPSKTTAEEKTDSSFIMTMIDVVLEEVVLCWARNVTV